MGTEKSEMVEAFKPPERHARLQHFSTRGGQCATPFCNTDDFALIGQTAILFKASDHRRSP